MPNADPEHTDFAQRLSLNLNLALQISVCFCDCVAMTFTTFISWVQHEAVWLHTQKPIGSNLRAACTHVVRGLGYVVWCCRAGVGKTISSQNSNQLPQKSAELRSSSATRMPSRSMAHLAPRHYQVENGLYFYFSMVPWLWMCGKIGGCFRRRPTIRQDAGKVFTIEKQGKPGGCGNLGAQPLRGTFSNAQQNTLNWDPFLSATCEMIQTFPSRKDKTVDKRPSTPES